MPIHWKPVVRWSCFLACLTLLGVGLYRFEADEPRWTMESSERDIDTPLRFSADGQFVYTSPFGSNHPFWFAMRLTERKNPKEPPPERLRVRELATGLQIAEHPATGALTRRNAFSSDGRYFAAICEWPNVAVDDAQHFLCLVDMQSHEERRSPLPPELDDADICFSPCGQYLVIGFQRENGVVQIYECATGQLLEAICNAQLLEYAMFADGKLLYGANGEADQNHIIHLWNLRDNKLAGTLDTGKERFWAKLQGERLVVYANPPATFRTWNVRTMRIESEWKSELENAYLADFVQVGDRWHALLRHDWTTYETWDIQSGTRGGTCKFPDHGYGNVYAPDGRWWAMYSPIHRNPFGGRQHRAIPLRMSELPSLKTAWELNAASHCDIEFTKDSKRVLVIPEDGNAIQIRDSATGEVQQTIAVSDYGNRFNAPTITMTKDRSNVLIVQTSGWHANDEAPIWRRLLQWLRPDPNAVSGSRDLVIVYDLDTNRERIRLRGWNISDALLSEDGASLVTTHRNDELRSMRCWDIGATKPMRWPFGLPAVLGVGLWGFSRGIGRWRRRRENEKAA